MSLDGFVLNALVHELNAELVGLRCEKVHQPTRNTATLLLTAKGKKHRLVISADPAWPRVLVSPAAWENPPSPPFFCLMLRKYLTGARLTKLSVAGFERVVTAAFLGRDELGNAATYRLMIELTGRHSNAVLVGPAGTVIDALTRVSMNLSSVRAVMPGLHYDPPPTQGRVSPESVTGEYLHLAASESEDPVHKVLYTNIQGVSGLLANELAYRYAPNAKARDLNLPEWELIAAQVRELAHAAGAGEVRAGYIYRADKARFHILPLTHLGTPGEEILGINALVAEALLFSNQSEQLAALRGSLRRLVAAALAKTERRIQALRGDLLKSEGSEKLRRFGDLLYANLGTQRLEGGEAVVIDYYDESMPEVRIPLDAKLSFADNAKQYYRQYARAQSTTQHAEERLRRDLSHLAYLETLLYGIDAAPDVETLHEISLEIGAMGLMPATAAAKRQATAPSLPRKFTCPDGVSISVGRTNTQNDRLVREAHPEHIWLHVQKAPGSHVLIHSTAGASETTLHYAANLAAYYSTLRASTNVPVDFTQRKFVKRPKEAPPGYVIYEQQRTLYVRQPTAPLDDQQDSNSST
ncbi:MAG: NFACT family protein [Selenomonadales bacterium]|jgi:predicted ribosome quality control (RQC) complex YloA/Tae2 family protein|nr:NFACT family protein [Selenomonadales bacterium]